MSGTTTRGKPCAPYHEARSAWIIKAAAPLLSAWAMKSWPSDLAPRRATKSAPGVTARES